MHANGSDQAARGALVVAKTKAGAPVWEAKWRDATGRQVKRRIGPAFLRHIDRPNPMIEGDDGQVIREGWRDRWEVPRTDGGRERRAPAGLLSHGDAEAKLRAMVAEHEDNVALAQSEAIKRARVAAEGVLTLEAIGEAWLAYAQRITGMRASTLTDYRSCLAQTVRSPQFRVAPVGHSWPADVDLAAQRKIADRWAPKPVEEITAGDVRAWRDSLLDAGASPRTANKLRQFLSNVLGWAARSEHYEVLTRNVVTDVERVKESAPGRIDFYEPEEVEHVARLLREGRHRRPARYGAGPRVKGRATVEREVSAAEREAMAREHEQDAALVTVLAFAGLRFGEAMALRWRDVNFASGKVEVWRSYAAGVEGATKGGHERTVPMVPAVAQVLARLGQRGAFVGRDDLVFASAVGGYLDPSAFRRRYKRACELAELRPLRVHDLRHGFLSVAARVFQPHEVQRLAGHADPRTTARYLHAKPQPHEAERLASAFGAGTPAEAVEEPGQTPV